MMMSSVVFCIGNTIAAVQTRQERLQSVPFSPFLFNNSRVSIFCSAKLLEKQRRKGQTNNKQVTTLMENQNFKSKPRILCLHGYRTSAAILQKSIERWPENVLEKLQLYFLDGPFLARGKSAVDRIFDPPYYEWYQSSQDFKDYKNFEECVAYIEEYMINHGPFDGLLGFSQGALISAAVPGMQAQGVAFTKVPKIKFLIIISGAKFGGYRFGQPKLAANAFSSPIHCPSLHIIGERDFLKPGGIDLLESFADPVVILHPKGHIIPTLDDTSVKTILSFIEKIQPITPSL